MIAQSPWPGSLVMGPKREYLYAAIRSTGGLASFRVDKTSGALAPVSVVEADADPKNPLGKVDPERPGGGE